MIDNKYILDAGHEIAYMHILTIEDETKAMMHGELT